MIDVMKPKQTFQQSEIQDGDIITFQRAIKEPAGQSILERIIGASSLTFWVF
jgi:hypothetical protein